MLLNFLHIIWLVFQIIIAVVLIFPLISYLLYLLVKRRENSKSKLSETQADYGIIVTAYKDISNIPNVVQSLLKLNYSNYVIYVVADNCPSLPQDFNNERVVIL
jgi:cellulose synthase/poly-beta-1,6-N-acetylglucosamine synthase-like glycosyltransferase